MKVNRDNTRENKNRVDDEYKFGDDVMLNKRTVYNYETPYTGPFLITQYWTNEKISSIIVATEIRYNIHRIKPYKSDTKVEDSNSINMYDYVNILSPVIYFCLNIKSWIQSI